MKTANYLNSIAAPSPLMTVEQVMSRCGCAAMNRIHFQRTAHQKGLPRVRLNARVIRYEPAAVENWLRRRGASGMC